MSKTVEEYMSLPYGKTILPIDESEGGGFLAEVAELGRHATCAWGATEEEALNNLKQVMKSNIEMWLKEGLDVPEPKNKKNYSGAISLRVPLYMHEFLAELAASQGVSVNALINNCIAEKMGIQKERETSKVLYHRHEIVNPEIAASRTEAREKSANIVDLDKLWDEQRYA